MNAARPAMQSNQGNPCLILTPHEVRSVVLATVQELLGLEDDEDNNQELDAYSPLMDMGLDSLAATQLVRELSRKLQTELSPTLLFDHPTIDRLVSHLTSLSRASKQNHQLAAVLNDDDKVHI